MKTKMTNYRWVICAMLFFATTINYMDRQVLGSRVGLYDSLLNLFGGISHWLDYYEGVSAKI